MLRQFTFRFQRPSEVTLSSRTNNRPSEVALSLRTNKSPSEVALFHPNGQKSFRSDFVPPDRTNVFRKRLCSPDRINVIRKGICSSLTEKSFPTGWKDNFGVIRPSGVIRLNNSSEQVFLFLFVFGCDKVSYLSSILILSSL